MYTELTNDKNKHVFMYFLYILVRIPKYQTSIKGPFVNIGVGSGRVVKAMALPIICQELLSSIKNNAS